MQKLVQSFSTPKRCEDQLHINSKKPAVFLMKEESCSERTHLVQKKMINQSKVWMNQRHSGAKIVNTTVKRGCADQWFLIYRLFYLFSSHSGWTSSENKLLEFLAATFGFTHYFQTSRQKMKREIKAGDNFTRFPISPFWRSKPL